MKPGEKHLRESLRRLGKARRRQKSLGGLEKLWPWVIRLLLLLAAALLAKRAGDAELILKFLELLPG